MMIILKLGQVFQKQIKLQGQGREVNEFVTLIKVVSQGINKWIMKGLSPDIQKLWTRFKFLRTDRLMDENQHDWMNLRLQGHKKYIMWL